MFIIQVDWFNSRTKNLNFFLHFFVGLNFNFRHIYFMIKIYFKSIFTLLSVGWACPLRDHELAELECYAWMNLTHFTV